LIDDEDVRTAGCELDGDTSSNPTGSAGDNDIEALKGLGHDGRETRRGVVKYCGGDAD
jgi:hypothetical protein